MLGPMDWIRPNYAVIYVILLCALANGGSEGKRWKPKEFSQNKSAFSLLLDTEVNKVELAWMNCRKDLTKRSDVVEDFDLHPLEGSIGMRPVILQRKNLHKAIKCLPPHIKQNLLDCIGMRSLTVPISEEESTHLSGYFGTPFRHPSDHRRYLASESPGPAEAPASYQPKKKSLIDENYQPISLALPPPNQDNSQLEIITYTAIGTAVILFMIVVFLCWQMNNIKKVEQKVGQEDKSSLLNLSDYSPGSQSSVCLENSEKKESALNNGKNSSFFGNLSTNPEDSKSLLPETAPSDSILPGTPMKPHSGKSALPPSLPPPPSPLPSPSSSSSSSSTPSIPLPSSLPPLSSPTTEPPKSPSTPTAPTEPPKSPSTPPAPTAPSSPSAPPACPSAPNPPAPPRIAQPPVLPQKPMTGKFRPSPLGHGDSSEGVESGPPKAKLKPFFWDKVLAKPGQEMVWHEISGGSFRFNEEMIESLFGFANQNQNEHKKYLSSVEPTAYIQIIDPKKAQNLSILLRALNVTMAEVVDALKEGNEIPVELIQTLLKMAPSADEELKLRLFTGELSQLGPAERFLKVIVDIPFAFKRLESLLFITTLPEETSSIKESLATLEVACNKLRKSRLFLKLLEAVLKTGNRMNSGTYRGGAQAFKLDTLLKLSDVKGTDGKTTLLHFVVQEIIRSEGVRAARIEKEGQSLSSVKTDEFLEDASEESAEHYRNLGLQVVSGLRNELKDVKRAAVVDGDMLTTTVSKLAQSLISTKVFLNTDMKSLEEDSEFYRNLASVVDQTEGEISWLCEEEKRIMALVKSTADYFHGNSGKDEGLRLFAIVRDFLIILDKVCKEVKTTTVKAPKKEVTSAPSSPDIRLTPAAGTSASSSPDNRPTPAADTSASSSPDVRPTPAADMRSKLFPAILERQVDESGSDSSDDES